MSNSGKLELHIELGVDLMHEILLLSEVSEELRLKIVEWRDQADKIIDE